MPLFHLAFALLGAAGLISPVAAVTISQVSLVVSSATSSFAPAVTYAGPTGSASSALKTSSKVVSQVSAATPASAAPYWLENIAHQGISAFNSNPAEYQVFRNVKSFGAKGKSNIMEENQF
jgi:glucan 1,3-beta-glucosidase